MTTEFWLGFTCGVLALLAVSVVVHLRSEKAKRRAFERETAAIDAKYSAPAPKASLAAPDIARLQELLSIKAVDGLTTAQVVEFNGVFQRLQKAPIALVPPTPKPTRKDVH